MEKIKKRHGEIPRDREVVPYCSSLNEAASARMALLLRAKGITKVCPLECGILRIVRHEAGEGQTILSRGFHSRNDLKSR